VGARLAFFGPAQQEYDLLNMDGILSLVTGQIHNRKPGLVTNAGGFVKRLVFV
jgi:hypothetical protein